MPTTTLTKQFSCVLLTAGLLCGGGFVTTTFAGPEAISSKDKNPIVEVPTACEPRWYLSIGGGADFDLGRTHINKSVFAPGIAPFTTAYIKEHKWNDVYDDAWRIQGEIGYVLTEHLEAFGLFKYAQADATRRTRGSEVTNDVLNLIGGPTLHFPISSEWDDYTAYGGELGLRCFFFSKQARFRPYLQISGGGTHVDKINIRTFVDESAIGGPSDVEVFHGGFFDDSWVWTASGQMGAEFSLNCHWTIGVQGGVRYESILDDNDRDLNSSSFTIGGPFGTIPFRFANGTNDDSGDRLVATVTGYLKFRFW